MSVNHPAATKIQQKLSKVLFLNCMKTKEKEKVGTKNPKAKNNSGYRSSYFNIYNKRITRTSVKTPAHERIILMKTCTVFLKV